MNQQNNHLQQLLLGYVEGVKNPLVLQTLIKNFSVYKLIDPEVHLGSESNEELLTNQLKQSAETLNSQAVRVSFDQSLYDLNSHFQLKKNFLKQIQYGIFGSAGGMFVCIILGVTIGSPLWSFMGLAIGFLAILLFRWYVSERDFVWEQDRDIQRLLMLKAQLGLIEMIPGENDKQDIYQKIISSLQNADAFPTLSKNTGRNERNRLSSSTYGQDYMIVIGIDEYEFCPRLSNCVKDAQDFIQVLSSKYGFRKEKHLITLFNKEATRINIYNYLREIKNTVRRHDRLLVYFSGHGERDGDEDTEIGFWVPVNARPNQQSEFIGTHEIKSLISQVQCLHVLLIVDACFAGTLFLPASYRSVRGSASYPSRFGLAASHSREIALDGQPGQNSPFARHLLNNLLQNNEPLSAQKLAAEITRKVESETEQTPVSGCIDRAKDRGGNFYFYPK